LLLLDEPTAGIELSVADALMAAITALARRDGLSALWVEHEMPLVARHSDRVVVLDRGRVVAGGVPTEVLASATHANADPGQTQ
jgi:ABC-type branched-subunit amino acid transport system ATPase component